MGHPLPSESIGRRFVENIAKEEENQMIYNFTNKDIFIVIDGTEVDGKKYFTLKLLYNILFHVTCVAHLLHNCAEKIRNKYKNTDLLISSLKAVTVKNPSRRNLFHEIGITARYQEMGNVA